jgi:large subunit ribosomal protein L6
MSRVGESPISVIDGVTVSINDPEVVVKGPLGELSMTRPGRVSVSLDNGTVHVTRTEESKEGRSMHGLTRSLIANMIEGVAKGYKKELLIEGVGFRAAVQGQELSLYLGFASPKLYAIPDGIKIEAEGGTRVSVTGIDKQRVGEVAARIRAYFPAEPYKGKGIRYVNEVVRRKVGKTVA